MPVDAPDIGHVIRYSYLWWDEHCRGKEEGLKDRPCSVVLNRKDDQGRTVLFVLPITHAPPQNPDHGIEIPPQTKKRLGRDEERSWIITTEYNKFIWPGYDIRKTPSGGYSYGILPEKLIRRIHEAVLKHSRDKALKPVGRD